MGSRFTCVHTLFAQRPVSYKGVLSLLTCRPNDVVQDYVCTSVEQYTGAAVLAVIMREQAEERAERLETKIEAEQEKANK